MPLMSIFTKLAHRVNIEKTSEHPPFSGGQDIQHVMHALSIVPKTVEIRAIMSGSILTNSTSKYTKFRQVLEKHNCNVVKINQGAFKESGTMVNTVAITFFAR